MAQLSIGEFARLTRLTPKALRIYARIGLLEPAAIDPDTGYRRYDEEDVRVGRLIGLLRGADLGLAEIGAILSDPELALKRLEGAAHEIDRLHADRKLLIRHVQAVLTEGEDPMFKIETRHVGAQRLMSIQRRLHGHETDAFAGEAKRAFAEQLNGAEPTGPFMLIFHGRVDGDNDGPLEAVLGCPDEIQPTEMIGVRTEPEHDEAYTTITKAQWAFPAILAAYDAVACSPVVAGHTTRRLSCREVYLVEPDEIGDDELVCDVAFPY
jgi:DNA-binding transcriptional MerR regulator